MAEEIVDLFSGALRRMDFDFGDASKPLSYIIPPCQPPVTGSLTRPIRCPAARAKHRARVRPLRCFARTHRG